MDLNADVVVVVGYSVLMPPFVVKKAIPGVSKTRMDLFGKVQNVDVGAKDGLKMVRIKQYVVKKVTTVDKTLFGNHHDFVLPRLEFSSYRSVVAEMFTHLTLHCVR